MAQMLTRDEDEQLDEEAEDGDDTNDDLLDNEAFSDQELEATTTNDNNEESNDTEMQTDSNMKNGDIFFDEDEMRKFADAGENDELRGEEDKDFDVTYDPDDALDTKKREKIVFKDFFDPPTKGDTTTTELTESTDPDAPISSHQKRMQKIKEINTRIEDESVSDKHWSLVGEISSRQRPENSLLETTLDFDHTAKPKPVITEEVTLSLEEMIKKTYC